MRDFTLATVNQSTQRISGMQLNYKVELLIGSDTPESFCVEEERKGNRDEPPYAIRYHIAKVYAKPVEGNGECISTTCSAPNIMYEVMTCRLPGAGS
ncbi:hypothetical protein DPMN_160857 [Dreissena polymorpha]|uniref:Uncharacterized protein n=1 Tax=Dreissena polymorpha TaxID=45954 RepID=A0A9D4ENM8_DREPO|nr:hypothetical protein DPMN_160857 [Dreissena polymorpha]